MEKTVQLDQRELAAAASIEQELTQTWAQVGMFSEQLEQARRQRDQAIEKQRGFIRQALADHGIQNFNNARPAAGAIIVTLSDMPEAVPVVPASTRANGAPVIDVT